MALIAVVMFAASCSQDIPSDRTPTGTETNDEEFAGTMLPRSSVVVPPTSIPPKEEDVSVVVAQEPLLFAMGISKNNLPFEGLETVPYMGLGEDLGYIMYFQAWGESQIKTEWLDATSEAGYIPVVSWEPHPFSSSFNKTVYDLGEIADGTYDEILVESFDNIKAHDGVVHVRFAHEMNGNWYPWSGYNEGNTPEEYVAAWRHVVDVANQVGATNIEWVWSPNAITYLQDRDIERLYPGDEYVDHVGIVGYISSDVFPPTFDERFRETITKIRTFTDLSIFITETGVSSDTPDRDAVICQFVYDMREDPDIKGFVWFDKNSRKDWRIGDAAASISEGLYGTC